MLAAASSERYEIEAVGISRDGRWSRNDEAAALAATTPAALPPAIKAEGISVEPSHITNAQGQRAATTVVLPLLHGPMGEDGTVQGLLDLAGVPYVGSGVLGSAVCMDKAMAKRVAAEAGIAQARWRSLHADECTPDRARELIDELGSTVFVKPANMGSSVGVGRANGAEQLMVALTAAAAYDEWLIVEEEIDGREIEVGVLGNRDVQASVPGEILPGDVFYSYADKYHDGTAQTVVPADLTADQTADVQQRACHAARALRVEGLARVDFFFEPEGRGFLLNEINTMPGFTPISMFPKLWQASGVSYPALIDRLVDLAVERHEKRLHHRSTSLS